jgi:hypothetical protein
MTEVHIVVVVVLFVTFPEIYWHEEFFVHVPMMRFWVMFCPVVGIIHLAGSPVYPELLLTFAVL